MYDMEKRYRNEIVIIIIRMAKKIKSNIFHDCIL